MICDLYKYERGGVKLEFSFERGDKNNEQKLIFRELMAKAISDLNQELHANNKTEKAG